MWPTGPFSLNPPLHCPQGFRFDIICNCEWFSTVGGQQKVHVLVTSGDKKPRATITSICKKYPLPWKRYGERGQKLAEFEAP